MQNEGTYKNSRKVRKPLISCDFDYEKRVEDPRVKIEETYYVTILLMTASMSWELATSKDLIHFEKHGIITLL
jgi:predicted GH43/DUF377 family glycosyl hydrolase